MAKELSKQKNVYSCLELDSFIPFLAATSFAKWQEIFLNTLKNTLKRSTHKQTQLKICINIIMHVYILFTYDCIYVCRIISTYYGIYVRVKHAKHLAAQLVHHKAKTNLTQESEKFYSNFFLMFFEVNFLVCMCGL